MNSTLRKLSILFFISVPVFAASSVAPIQDASRNPEVDAPVIETSAGVDSPAEAFPVETVEPPAADFSMFRVLGGLGLVICLIIGGYFGARKVFPRYFSKRTSDKNLRIIETLPMGDKRSISLIEVGQSRLLIGNTPQQINLIMALPDHLSLVSEPETSKAESKELPVKDTKASFRNLFEIEKKRTAIQSKHPLPEDVLLKMRQLRDALER